MPDRSMQSTADVVLQTTRKAITETGYALVGAGAYVLDAVRGDRATPQGWRRVGERTAAWTQEARDRTAEGFQTLSERGRTALPELQELRWQARAVMGDVSEAAEDAAEQARRTATRAETTAAEAEAEARPEAEPEAGEQPDYSEMTVEELREHARDADIHGRSQMNKDELVEALQEE